MSLKGLPRTDLFSGEKGVTIKDLQLFSHSKQLANAGGRGAGRTPEGKRSI